MIDPQHRAGKCGVDCLPLTLLSDVVDTIAWRCLLRCLYFAADHDTAYVARCKKAGHVFMGRSSSPEFGLNPNTEPRLYGSCHNPWNFEYSPGGSSGGAATAVSAGILPVAACNRRRRLDPDPGGAVRPVRLKPSRGRVSMAPDAGEGWGGCQPDMWSAAVCVIPPLCSIALPDWSLAIPILRHPAGTPSFKPLPVRHASSGSL